MKVQNQQFSCILGQGDTDLMKKAMGVLQHHDAVSGTAKQAVTYDYALRLARGFKQCEDTIKQSLTQLLPKTQSVPKPNIQFCRMTNVTQCQVSESNFKFVVHVYNPLIRKVTKFIRLPIVSAGYQVIGPDGESVQTQVVPISKRSRLIPGRRSKATSELIFKVEIPPMGFKSFYVMRNQSQAQSQMSRVYKLEAKTILGKLLIALCSILS